MGERAFMEQGVIAAADALDAWALGFSNHSPARDYLLAAAEDLRREARNVVTSALSPTPEREEG